MLRQSTIVVAVTALLAACASQRIQMIAASDQDSIIRDGVPALVSKKKHLVMLKPNAQLLKGNARPAFTVVVRNLGVKPENLLESGISASQTVQGKVVAVRVYRYEELVKEEETRQAVAALGTALSAAGRSMSAANAGYVNTTGSVHAYGPYGSSYGTYSGTTYDPLRAQLAQQAANAQTDAEIANLRAEGEQNLAGLQRTILKDNTVMAGEWFGGSIVLDPPEKNQGERASYVISIDFGGEQHTFNVVHVEG